MNVYHCEWCSRQFVLRTNLVMHRALAHLDQAARRDAEQASTLERADKYISLIHQAVAHHHDFHSDCDHFRIADNKDTA